MANVTAVTGSHVTITGLDADWYLSNDLADWADTGLLLRAIRFNPSATDDIMVIIDGPAGGGFVAWSTAVGEMFRAECATAYDDRIRYYNAPPMRRYYPVIDISACTLDTAANAVVTFEFA